MFNPNFQIFIVSEFSAVLQVTGINISSDSKIFLNICEYLSDIIIK